jgi:hypothetical protein
MNLEQEIRKEHSQAQTMRIVKWVGRNQSRFDELVHLFLTGEYRVVQRSAWPLSYCVEQHPLLVKKHLKKIVRNLLQPGLHDAVKRNTMRFLQDISIPPSLQGLVMDICFRYLEAPNEAVAIKAFSLTVLANLSKKYPEIVPELKLVIEAQMPRQTPAFTSRANKFLRSLTGS